MNKKAVIMPLVVMFFDIVFILAWIFLLAPLLSLVGALMVSSGGATGFEAFFYMNLNALVLFVFLLFNFAFIYGGSQ